MCLRDGGSLLGAVHILAALFADPHILVAHDLLERKRATARRIVSRSASRAPVTRERGVATLTLGFWAHSENARARGIAP